MSSLSRMVIALALAGAGFVAGLAWPQRAVQRGPASALAPAAQTRAAAQGQGRPAPVPEAGAGGRGARHDRPFRAGFSLGRLHHLAGLQRDFFSLNVQEVPQGTGSGFIWDRQGHVVTNFHVIQGASGAQVTLADQSTWDAELVGASPRRIWPCCASRRRRTPAPAAARQLGQPAGGPEGVRDRQPVRPRPDADHRHRQRAGPRDPVASTARRSAT